MSERTADAVGATVRRAVTVRAGIERAFAMFTDGFDSWWPRTHHVADRELQVALIEPHVGGRWYERDVDGGECVWGRVLAWEPPHRVLLSWQLNAEFAIGPDPERTSEVEVRFTAQGPEETLVELMHRNLERHGTDADAIRRQVSSDGGWGGLLQRYAEAVRP